MYVYGLLITVVIPYEHNRQERPLFVQPHLVKEGDEVRASHSIHHIIQSNHQTPQPTYQPYHNLTTQQVRLQEFPATVEGIVQSFAARYPALDEASGLCFETHGRISM